MSTPSWFRASGMCGKAYNSRQGLGVMVPLPFVPFIPVTWFIPLIPFIPCIPVKVFFVIKKLVSSSVYWEFSVFSFCLKFLKSFARYRWCWWLWIFSAQGQGVFFWECQKVTKGEPLVPCFSGIQLCLKRASCRFCTWRLGPHHFFFLLAAAVW